MDIPLNEKTPVQKNYVAVPRPLYTEVKSDVEDTDGVRETPIVSY